MDGRMNPATLELTDEEKLLREALDRYDYGREVDGPNRKAARDDWDFAVNMNHWPPDAKKARKGRPIVTVDKLSAFLHQVTNDQRQNRPAIKIRPFDDLADKQTAKVLQGLIRHIEYCSRAHIAYDTSYDHAVTCGIGFFRVLTKYKAGSRSSDGEQDLYIQRINNWDSVILDPDHQEPDGSDAAWAFIEDEMDLDAFKEAYPEADPASWNSESFTTSQKKWVKKDKVKVAEYFKVIDPDGDRRVKWYKLCAGQVLEERDWPGKHIPIVVVYGEEKFFEGKRVYQGLVRRAKDPQRMYNYWASVYTEIVSRAPKAKWVGTLKQFEGLEKYWANANTDDTAFLPYNTDPQAPGAPQRQGGIEVPAGIVQGLMQASEDLKAVTGIFDASLGSRGNETSGKAIMARQREGDTANYHFLDNLTTSIQHLGRILIDLIPKIYDTARIVRILGEDGKEELVGINFPPQDQIIDPDILEMLQSIETVITDLSVGQYDVVVDVGPAYATKRQEESEKLLSMLQSVPMIGNVAPDLVVKTVDIEKGDEIAERLRRALPPNLTQEMGPDGKPVQGAPNPEMMAAQQQMQAMQAEMAQMAEALKEAQAGTQEKAIERETKLTEAQIKAQTEMTKAQSAERVAMIELEAARVAAIPDPAIQEAEDVKTQQVMEALAGLLQQNAAQQAQAIGAMAQSINAVAEAQAQGNALQLEIAKMLAAPKKVVINRGEDGKIESAAAVPVGMDG
jgi:hypothetical protein